MRLSAFCGLNAPVFLPVLLGLHAHNLPEGFRKVAGGTKVKLSGDLGNAVWGRYEQNF